MEEIIISVFNTVGCGFCIEVDDGQKVYNLIEKAFRKGRKINFPFKMLRC